MCNKVIIEYLNMFAWCYKRFLITRVIFFLFMYYLFVNKLYKDVQGGGGEYGSWG